MPYICELSVREDMNFAKKIAIFGLEVHIYESAMGMVSYQ